MDIIKFDSNNKPAYVREDWLIADYNTNNFQKGWWVKINDRGEEDQVENGDYIIYDGGFCKVITQAEYQASFIQQNYIQELMGKLLIADLFKALKEQNISQADEGDIISRVQATLTALATGFVRGAKNIANNTATGGAFTVARKTYLLGQIDLTLAKI